MKVLGVDPGGRWWGWALLDGCAYLAAGVLDLEELGEAPLLARLHAMTASAAGLAIERPGGVAPGIARVRPAAAVQASAEIARAAWIAGELAGLCSADGLRVQRVAAADVRTHFFGRPSADDDAVEALVRLRVAGWPPRLGGHGSAYGAKGWLLSQRRAHAHDAAATGLYGACTGLREAA